MLIVVYVGTLLWNDVALGCVVSVFRVFELSSFCVPAVVVFRRVIGTVFACVNTFVIAGTTRTPFGVSVDVNVDVEGRRECV